MVTMAKELDCGSGVTIELAPIPAGQFMMGSTESEADRRRDEGPQREVVITNGFHMGVTPVTQAQWEAVMGTTPWEGMASVARGGENAANWIAWHGAVEFCRRLSAATGQCVCVPTEAEWEYACRVGTTTRFYYGDDDGYDDLGEYAWYESNAYNSGAKHAQPVGRKKPNAWGLYDMHGNVWEWCADWRGESYQSDDVHDPKGPPSGQTRVLRGGSWVNSPQDCRAAHRGWNTPDYRNGLNGLRVVVLD